jgi:type II secretory pathway pseudopilin PulG
MYTRSTPLPVRCPQRRFVDRRGFTIMELLLVMSLLIMIGAISAPSFTGWAENQRLRKSGDIIRTVWSRARIKAMKSGQTIVFRYEIGGSRYRVEAWQTPGEMADFGMTGRTGDNTPLPLPNAEGNDPELAAENGTGSQGLSSQAAEQVLPRSITFVGSEIEMDARDIFAGEQAMADGQAMPGDMSTSWSSPILFYPDGSASQTKLQLTDSKATRFVIVSLRGMTGLSQATDIITQQDTMDLEAEDLGP